jgi:hypothetical protein
MFLGKWPAWRTILFYIFIFIFNSQDWQIVSTQPLVTVPLFTVGGRVVCRSDTATDTEWQLPEVVLTQFVSPDDEHDVLETCRKLNVKIST